MDKPIRFEKGKYYISSEKINAYYDVNEGKFFSVKTGKPYKGVVNGFAKLLDQCEDDSYYDNGKFQFSPKELAFIVACRACYPISTVLTQRTKQNLIERDQVLSVLTLPKRTIFTGENINRTVTALVKLENITLAASLWKEYYAEAKGNIDTSILLDDFCDWVDNRVKETRENQFKTLMVKYTQNEETIMAFQSFYKHPFYDSIFEETKLSRAVYYYERGLRDYYKDIRSDWESVVFQQLKTHFQMCEEMNIKPPKENWFVARCQVLKDYVSWKNAALNARLASAQEPKKEQLAFENDNFIVIVPTTSDEFVREANAQRNCVNSWYKEQVADKETHVVFVRKKSNPTKSYITCEVSNNGYITQFLLAFNRQCSGGTPEADFRRAYQNHLSSVWND